MFRSDRYTSPGNYPGSEEIVLGWTLSGRTTATLSEHDIQDTFLILEDNSLGHNLNRFWEV